MNVDGIPYAHEPWAFDAVTGICLVIAVGISAYFIQQHWFRR
jgi:zinc transporter